MWSGVMAQCVKHFLNKHQQDLNSNIQNLHKPGVEVYNVKLSMVMCICNPSSRL